MLSRALRVALGFVVALGVTLATSRTARAEVRVERSDDAASCPDTAAFAERLRDAAAKEPAVATSRISVRFELTTSGYRSWIRTTDGKQRSLTDDAPNCDGMAEATVLAVRLALELEVPPVAAPSVAAPPPPPSAATADAVPAPSVSVPPPRRASPFAEIAASGVVVLGLASPVASGARAGGALVLAHGYLSLGITGLVLPSRTRNIAQGTVDLSVLGGGIEGCGRLPIGASLLLGLCGRAEAMSLAGTAHGFDRSEAHARPVLTATLLARARARIMRPVALFVEGGALVPFARERFSIDTVGVIYDPPAVAAATGIGVVVDFE